jgi:hypothetical protein
LFSAVSLKTLKQVEVQKTALKSFEISCAKKPLKAEGTQGPVKAGAKKK